MKTLTKTWRVIVPLVFALPVFAQRPIFVVDASGGPGSQFTDLPQAVATVPDGSVLVVRPGFYQPFSIDGKGLSIIGDDPTLVRIGSSNWISISNTTTTQSVVLRNASIYGNYELRLSNAKGLVLLENITSNIVFAASHCDNVQLHRTLGTELNVTDSAVHLQWSTLVGASGLPSYPSGPWMGDRPALTLQRSRCIAVASSLTGGSSVAFFSCSLGGFICYLQGPGADGVTASQQSSFISLRSTVTGGMTGATYYPNGCGIALSGGSTAFFAGASPTGGSFGGTVGAPFSLDPTSAIQIDPNAAPSAAEIRGTQQLGQVVQFSLEGAPQSVGVLFFATDPTLTPIEPLALGSFLSASVLSILPFFIPASGTGQWPFGIPSTYPLGETYYWQFVTIEPGTNRLWVTNSFALHVSS